MSACTHNLSLSVMIPQLVTTGEGSNKDGQVHIQDVVQWEEAEKRCSFSHSLHGSNR